MHGVRICTTCRQIDRETSSTCACGGRWVGACEVWIDGRHTFVSADEYKRLQAAAKNSRRRQLDRDVFTASQGTEAGILQLLAKSKG